MTTPAGDPPPKRGTFFPRPGVGVGGGSPGLGTHRGRPIRPTTTYHHQSPPPPDHVVTLWDRHGTRYRRTANMTWMEDTTPPPPWWQRWYWPRLLAHKAPLTTRRPRPGGDTQ
jgi:hypothetical protein